MCAEIMTAFTQVKFQDSTERLPPSPPPANDDYPDEDEFETEYLDEAYEDQ